MYILVTYDVNTEEREGQRRLARVARVCMNYGRRVQNSVFECVLTEVQLIELKDKLSQIMDTVKDSIRIYYLNRTENRRIITLGRNTSVAIEAPLIL